MDATAQTKTTPQTQCAFSRQLSMIFDVLCYYCFFIVLLAIFLVTITLKNAISIKYLFFYYCFCK